MQAMERAQWLIALEEPHHFLTMAAGVPILWGRELKTSVRNYPILLSGVSIGALKANQ